LEKLVKNIAKKLLFLEKNNLFNAMIPVKKYFLFVLKFIFALLLINCSGNQDYKVAESPQKIIPLKIGDTIPEITVYDEAGNPLQLNNLISEKPSILIVYRGIWSMYCNQHISELEDIAQELYDMGFQIIAVTSDKPEKVVEMKDKYDVSFTIVSDTSNNAIKALGLAYDARKIYWDMLLVLEENSGNKYYILPVPAMFIINKSGVIMFEYINPNFKVRISPELLLTAAKVALEE
jgi:peroxiredoxin